MGENLTYTGKQLIGEKITSPINLPKNKILYDHDIIEIDSIWYRIDFYKIISKKGEKYYYWQRLLR
jgi:hypothetical protein